MPETHIVHATATFSELGIAAASVLLADLPKWRKVSEVDPTDPIARNDLSVAGKRLGGIACWVVELVLAIPRTLNKLIFLAPFASFVLGVYALIGISHYPPALVNWSIISFETSSLDTLYWWMAFVSFTVAMVSVVVERSRAKAYGEVLEATSKEF